MATMVPSPRSSMALRQLFALSKATASVSYRVFSTSLTRLESSRSRASATPNGPSTRRRNPLIGNLPPSSSSPPKAASRDGDGTSVSSISANNPSSYSPPPPPPPGPGPGPAPTPAAVSSTPPKLDTAMATEKPQPHPYTAASSASPINIDLASIIASRASNYSGSLGPNASTDPQRLPQIRSDAAKGRTVFISADRKPGTVPNVQAAMRQLNRLNREDFVKLKYNSQREHERKGLKRKRLRSERWKARFKMGFKAAAERVLYLKKQGW